MNLGPENPLLSIDPTLSNMEKFHQIVEAVGDLQAKYAQLQAQYTLLQVQNAQIIVQNNFLSGMMFQHNQMPKFPCSRPKAPYHGAEDHGFDDNGAEDHGFDDNEADDNEADDNEADDNEAEDNEAEDNEAEDNEAEDNEDNEADNREADNREAEVYGSEDNGSEDYGSEGNEDDDHEDDDHDADDHGSQDRGAEVRGAEVPGAEDNGNLAIVTNLELKYEKAQTKSGCQDLTYAEQQAGKGDKPDYRWHPNNRKIGRPKPIFYSYEAGKTGFRWIYHILEEDPDYDFQGNLNTQHDVYQSYYNWATTVNKENKIHIHQITMALAAAEVLKLKRNGDVTWFKRN
jgi:hypothetical protein